MQVCDEKNNKLIAVIVPDEMEDGWCAMGGRHVKHARIGRATPNRVPKFAVDGTTGGGLAVSEAERALGLKLQQQAGNGKQRSSHHQDQNHQRFVAKIQQQQQSVIMAAAAKVARRVPLIKFPNRKAGETQGAQAAVNRASGGGQSQAMSQASLPSGTASSQPPRTKMTEEEIEAILLGGAAP